MLRLLPRKIVRIDLTDAAQHHEPISIRRRQMMDEINTLNPSATADFLEQFDDDALAAYLEHLTLTQRPRGRESRWVRPHGRPWASAAAACA